MNRLVSALVLGIYLASCAPALLPPAGSAEAGWQPGRAASSGQAAAEMPDAAKEERLVTAWLKKMAQQNDRLNQALREQIPEMIREHGGLRPAPGFDPESVWSKPPHVYAYQVSRDDIEISSGDRAGEIVPDVRQAGFLFDRVTEEELAVTEYIGKAEFLKPFFRQFFCEPAMQRAAGNLPASFVPYPLLKAVKDKGLKPADYASFEAYYELYRYRIEESELRPEYAAVDRQSRLDRYGKMISLEHRAYLKQLDLYELDRDSLLAEGETAPEREYIMGHGIDFDSPDFEERLNGFSVRKSAFENVGEILDGHWEALKGVSAFRRVFEWAVENIGTYLSMAGVDTRVNLPNVFLCRYRVQVYRCRAPYLAVCGAAQAAAFGWLEVPIPDVHLEGDSSYIDLPRITSLDSNKLGIRYASFEAAREHGQRGFSGYDGEGSAKARPVTPDLNSLPGQPDRFAMGTYRGERNYRGSDVFREAYLQCNYPYKVFSRAALKGLSPAETAAAVQAITFGSVPAYWHGRFHGSDDNRDTGWLLLDIALTVITIIDLIDLGHGAGLLLMSRIALKRAAAREALAMRHFAAVSMDEHLVWEGAQHFEGFRRAYIKYVGPRAGFPPSLLGKATPDGFRYVVLNDGNVYMVPNYLQQFTTLNAPVPNLDTGYAKLTLFGYLRKDPTVHVREEFLMNILDDPFHFSPFAAANERRMFYFSRLHSPDLPAWEGTPASWYLFKVPVMPTWGPFRQGLKPYPIDFPFKKPPF